MSPNAARLRVVGGVLLVALATSCTRGEHVEQRPGAARASAGVPLDPARVLGLWSSSFGAVKIVADETRGKGALSGVWVYDDRTGKQVVGYFEGTLAGNVLRFRWTEPGPPPLVGDGEVAFDPSGTRFAGGWATARGDDGGEWTGWREAPPAAAPAPAPTPEPAAPALDAGPSGPALDAATAEPARTF